MPKIDEECGLLIGDCTVICCCCPCMLVQITVFVVFRLPKKLIKKMKGIILEKKRRRKMEKGEVEGECVVVLEGRSCVVETSFRIEDEKVWEELLGQGLFWFGSFWGGEDRQC
ncbi:uncharacterized protein LOC109839470 [Asparagus officinalis]|uniref:uncharacterized protein LOC109839470 n=1 Tax=Asparagus officinalis TaxID=4686 RepID=UPI00098E1912|nr:uncharacterized protein LOC109839470 [Asparagus officinalis]